MGLVPWGLFLFRIGIVYTICRDCLPVLGLKTVSSIFSQITTSLWDLLVILGHDGRHVDDASTAWLLVVRTLYISLCQETYLVERKLVDHDVDWYPTGFKL